jgi:cysteine synthase A
MSILDAVGNTPLVELRRLPPAGAARVLVKLEYANPTGSMKDRLALAAISAAEADGRLLPGGTVVEYTGEPPASPWPSCARRRGTSRGLCSRTRSARIRA